jgi:sugar lactone lactonase YvrE
VSRSAQLILLLAASLLPSSSAAPHRPIAALAPVEIVTDRLSSVAGVAVAEDGTVHAAAVQPLTALDPAEIYADGFGDVRGIVVDPQGNLYVADHARGTVRRMAPDRRRTRVTSGLKRPVGLALDSEGHLLIAEEKAGRVVRVEPNGRRTVLVSGVKQPRWLATLDDGTLFISARLLTRDTDPEPDDESDEPEVILQLTPAGQLHVFADGFKHLQGLAATSTTLFAATQGWRGKTHVDGVVFQLPILADGSPGLPQQVGPADEFKKPVGLARDRLGALYLTTKKLDLLDDHSRRAVAKLHPTGVVTLYAENLDNPQGVAFDPDGNLYVADGHSGRILRFRAPPPPGVTAPAVTNQSPVQVTGTTAPGARVDLFMNVLTPVTVTADAAGAFAASIALTANAATTLEVFATSHGGQGLTSRTTETTIVHDSVAPTLSVQAPPAGAHVRGDVSVEAQASDTGSGLALLALTVDGQTLPALIAPTLPAPAAAATAAWTTTLVADGAHTLGAIATDQASNANTAARVVLVDNTPPDTLITSGPSGQIIVTEATFTFKGTDNLTPAGNFVFAWRLDGGGWSAFDAATTASFTNLAPGPHLFEVTARDLAGNEDPTPAQQSFTVGAGVRIVITSPSDGATVPQGLLLITGTVEARGAEVSVSVNAMPAAVQGTAFAALVLVTPETTDLTAIATSLSGATASHSVAVTVSSTSEPGIALAASPGSGVAPLSVTWQVANQTGRALVRFELDPTGGGTFGLPTGSLEGARTMFSSAGLFFPVVRATDDQGTTYTATTVVRVEDPPAVAARFRARWATFKARLQAGDIPGALDHVVPRVRPRFASVFQQLGVSLPAIAAGLGNLEVLEQGGNLAETAILQMENGVPRLHLIYFRRDGLGRWLIEEM